MLSSGTPTKVVLKVYPICTVYMASARLVIANSELAHNAKGMRRCKACTAEIVRGEFMVYYTSHSTSGSSRYHCLSCAQRYNPSMVTKRALNALIRRVKSSNYKHLLDLPIHHNDTSTINLP